MFKAIFCSPILHSVLAVVCHVLGGANPWGGGGGSGCGFFKIVVFSVTLRPSTGQGAGRQAKRAVVNEEWERDEIVTCITVPDTSILAESNQLSKCLSPSNSQTEA